MTCFTDDSTDSVRIFLCRASHDVESKRHTAPRPVAPVAAEPLPAAPPFRSRTSANRRIPAEILGDEELNSFIATRLPRTHDFEVHRSVWKLRRAGARHIGLQLPEGLQGWATALADIFSRFVPTAESSTIFGDVTFGACCIDDLGASALGVDFLIHYGHSCIVPTDQTTVTTLYVHVEVEVDVEHLVDTVRHNFTPDKRLAFMSSVQFSSGTLQAVDELRKEAEDRVAKVPQVKPLGIGETLGCTSPNAGDVDAAIFVCDGRFHLESAMIQNPQLRGNFFRYDPVCQTLTREGFAHDELHSSRRAAIAAAREAQLVGLVLGTLGRQGSVGVLEEIERLLDQRGVAHFTILLSEISPERLALMPKVQAWVQVACPRLSMDWGSSYEKPLLTPYEAHVAYGGLAYKDVYPMDYYSNKGGPWANYGAHNGHGGSVGQKFRHLGQKNRRHLEVEYD
ncbi:Dph1 [Symbiodinium pilosum]|uniref:2-(3-amino-3-carboxypropyl)histidine synthase subunit 1 n=1 Tax=Symbiodinium pilosum TaxID=2952 RepID=A0A812XI70_SYMPI|nr:Dph1 [Symbiodinium pilosum]